MMHEASQCPNCLRYDIKNINQQINQSEQEKLDHDMTIWELYFLQMNSTNLEYYKSLFLPSH